MNLPHVVLFEGKSKGKPIQSGDSIKRYCANEKRQDNGKTCCMLFVHCDCHVAHPQRFRPADDGQHENGVHTRKSSLGSSLNVLVLFD